MSVPRGAGAAVVLPSGFQDTTVFSGLAAPTAFRFAPDGRVFVAEKSGRIKVFDNLSDTTPTIFADLRTQVHNFWDRGLLNLVLDPNFPTEPYVYVLYVHNATIGGTAPRWPTTDGTSDECPTPPGATDDGCVVSGRLSRLQASGNAMTGSEQVLVEDWCQQYPSHSGGGLGFGADGALYVSGGDGAAFNFTDYGQRGDPLNPCGDPPGGVGAQLSPPTTEGGRLRAQDLRTAGDPVGLNGSLIRIDPDTGAGFAGNPLSSSMDQNARRIVAYGFRNPYRLAIRPGTNDVFVGDVGEGRWEEIDRVPDFVSPLENFGWPCYQGGADSNGSFVPVRNPSFDSLNINICESLYSEEPNGSKAPYFAYAHDVPVVPGEACTAGAGNAVTGLAFAPANTTYPAAYRNGLFVSDYARDCIWFLPAGTNGLPDPGAPQLFAQGALDGIHLEIGPNGDLFYLDWGETSGSIHRVSYTSGNRSPVALAAATPTNGPAPLAVSFDGSGSSDPDSEPLTYAWDLDGDGDFDDSTAQKPSFTYAQTGNYTVQLKVTDPHGAFDTDSIVISAGNAPPIARIVYPNPPMAWEVGQRFTFQGTADDQQDGALPPSAYSWSLLLHHCSATGSGCHTHTLQTFSGTAGGSFIPPDHNWPSRLELQLTVTDSGGLQDTKTSLLDPVTTVLVFDSNPRGMQLTVGGESNSTPFARRVIVGSRNSVSAPGQVRDGTPYGFSSWSDGNPQSHEVIATQSWTYTATFTADAERPSAPSGLVANAPSAAQVDLSWTAAGDNVGVTNYNVYRDGVLLMTTGSTPGFSDTTVSPGTTYSYRVRALDAAGNESDPSNVATVTTPAAVPATLTFAPEADTRVEEANPTTNFGTQTTLRSEGGLDPDIETYLRFRVTGVSGPLQSAKLRLWVTDATADGPAVYTTGNSWSEIGATWDNRPGRTSGPVDDKGAVPTGAWVEYDVRPLVGADGTYSFVLATSHADAVSFRSRESTVTTERPQLVLSFLPGPSDFLRPNPPSGLTAQATSSGRVDLAWDAATDNVGVTNYRIYRDGAVLATVGPVTSFFDTTAARGTPYTYSVTALDAAGNESDPSNAVTLTTPSLVTQVLGPSADARVEESNPTVNLGTDTRLRAEGGSDPDIESYLRFRVTGISGVLQSAKLRLWITDGTADGPAVHTAADNSWIETAITWANKPARALGPTDDKPALATGTWVDYDVKPLMTGDGTYTFILVTGSADAVSFIARESSDATHRPELVLTYGNP